MTLEQLQKQVRAIGKAVNKLRESGVSDRALYLLIQANCESVGKYNSKKPSRTMIAAVLDSMETLESFITESEDES